MMAWPFAILIVAIAGSFVQDLLLPKFLRQAEETPVQSEPETTERSIMALVLDDMQSLDLINLNPPHAEKKPLSEEKPQPENQHIREKAAA